MRRYSLLAVAAVFCVFIVTIGGCDGAEEDNGEPPMGDGVSMEKAQQLSENAFTELYSPVEVDVSARVPGYELPLDLSATSNSDAVSRLAASDSAKELLRQNGFAVTGYRQNTYDKISAFYKGIKQQDIPIFVTTDSLLHLYHIQFDKTLKDIEENEFFDALIELTETMQATSKDQYDTLTADMHTAARYNWAYFTVALKVLQPETRVPDEIADDVNAEVQLIEDHAGADNSPLFGYQEDYSQYVPRGHYTRSEKLKKYFKAMMWYGRITMLVAGKDIKDDALVSGEIARRQTRQACLIAGALHSDAEQLQQAKTTWERIYQVTAFFAGLADDLIPADYSDVLNEVLGASYKWKALADDETLLQIREKLALQRKPKIYGGTGMIEVQPPLTPEQLSEALGTTQGMRFMGQRFIPDSYMMGELVAPTVSSYLGEGSPFTVVDTAAGRVRGFPRGLDVMSILGSDRAADVLEKLGDTDYKNYDDTIAALKAEFDAMDDAAWHKNLYWAWLYSLKSLLGEWGDGWPTFMTTTAWQDKMLNTALGSWAQLRHDTILYAKQSYTMTTTAMPPQQEGPVEGYVEPVPEFYARLLSLTRMTRKGLVELEAADDQAISRLESMESIIQRLLDISQKELADEALSEEDYAFIEDFGENLSGTVAGVETEGLETTIVADVHTDQNSSQVLEEGTGFLKSLAVAYRMPQGNVVVGCGPVLSYYEFKQPMSDRLTDEAWKEMLVGDSAPAAPEWTDTFMSQ
ncbi:MAG: DUF3160 domain-containing protein [Armatimonadota bacterium]